MKTFENGYGVPSINIALVHNRWINFIVSKYFCLA